MLQGLPVAEVEVLLTEVLLQLAHMLSLSME